LVFLLMYAVAIWAVAVIFRRRWLSFVVIIAAMAPVALITHWVVGLNIGASATGRPLPPTALYAVGTAYGGLIFGVGLLIAVQPRKEAKERPCPVCEYEVKGIEGPCPECGHDLAAPVHSFRPAPAAAPVAPPDEASTQAVRDHLRRAIEERQRERRREDELDRGVRPTRGRASLDPSA
jgi:hypothetical protein